MSLAFVRCQGLIYVKAIRPDTSGMLARTFLIVHVKEASAMMCWDGRPLYLHSPEPYLSRDGHDSH